MGQVAGHVFLGTAIGSLLVEAPFSLTLISLALSGVGYALRARDTIQR